LTNQVRWKNGVFGLVQDGGNFQTI